MTERQYPAYVVLTPNAVYHCATLAEALGRRGQGGMVYEPLGMSAARKVADDCLQCGDSPVDCGKCDRCGDCCPCGWGGGCP